MDMKLYYSLAILLIICATTLPTKGEYHSKTKLHNPKPLKTTTLHFFFHDILSGNNPGALLVAKPNITLGHQPGMPFGSVYAIDDRLTEGPEPNSTVIGNAQGLYLSSGKDELSPVLYADFGFTTGEFNGSSISVFSRNPVMSEERELAVVGGRDKFRMAQGFAHLKTYSLDTTTGDAVIEYHVTVFHY